MTLPDLVRRLIEVRLSKYCLDRIPPHIRSEIRVVFTIRGKKFVIEGGFDCIGGTGRYEGFKGTGTFKGERIGELKTGGDAYYDFTMNCKKP